MELERYMYKVKVKYRRYIQGFRLNGDIEKREMDVYDLCHQKDNLDSNKYLVLDSTIEITSVSIYINTSYFKAINPIREFY